MMVDIIVPSMHSYNTRQKKSMTIILLVAGVMVVFSSLSGHNMLLVSSIILLLLFIQLQRSNSATAYFIKRLVIKNESVLLIYDDRGTEKTLAGTLDDIMIKKGIGFRSVYLSIYKDKKLLLKQFIQGEWTEEKFDEVEQYIRKFRITGREIV
jgi:hypothetical protein